MNRTILIAILLACVYGVQGQENHLDKKISLHAENIPVGELIFEIGELGNFQFSYNSSIIDPVRRTSVHAEEERVRRVLGQTLGSDYRYKTLGNHVVILKNKPSHKPTKEERKMDYLVNGTILDHRTGETIFQASIYEIEGRKISASDENGNYALVLNHGEQERHISYSKVGYYDTIILVRPLEETPVNVMLKPIPSPVDYIPKAEPAQFNMNATPFVAALVPGKAVTMADNIQVQEDRFFQISFLPFLGSNRFVSGMLTNRFSINVLAGYSGGVKGLELGGLVNMNRGNMDGVQLAGFGNIVGKNTNGWQGAGFFNVTAGTMNGIQMAGFTNIAIDTIKGAQLSGFANVLHGRMMGPQLAGFANFTSQNVDGMQIAGFTNITVKDVLLGQISGFANYSRNVSGVQLAGFTNIATGTNRAVQLAGFLNYATDVHGLQISAFNFADTVSAGAPIGIFSFVRKGFHPLEISTEELFWSNLSFKTGINGFYNIFSVGATDSLAYAGYGLGSQVYWGKKFATGLEFHTRAVITTRNGNDFMGLQNKLQFNLVYRKARHFAITTGPSINTMILDKGFPLQADLLFPDLFKVNTANNSGISMKYWLGWSFAIRL